MWDNIIKIKFFIVSLDILLRLLFISVPYFIVLFVYCSNGTHEALSINYADERIIKINIIFLNMSFIFYLIY